jgi:hypothetical protein
VYFFSINVILEGKKRGDIKKKDEKQHQLFASFISMI